MVPPLQPNPHPHPHWRRSKRRCRHARHRILPRRRLRWRLRQLDLIHTAVRQLAQDLHAIVISVNYWLAPEHRFPCQYEDGFDALRFIDEMDGRDLPANAGLNR
ncbi:hypothetical protein FH972_012278 [Carpinus fangiana]|uniref:Alpha/beta hydrolase fold-3 domain-containing protein n=1 Tax=Carpinus fangiana TaxID=176857 RepID=A0A5N6R6G2_9ROSI|nr:hypothetical protein FH972_012278 [Carpinus fangiana]